MVETHDMLKRAKLYNQAMPKRIRRYLNGRGVPDHMIDFHLLGWNAERITIPVFDREGEPLFFRLAKDPADYRAGPKMLTPAGGSVELYGWERLRTTPSRIIICEGEFDRLVLESYGFLAVTSTGGAGVFRREWAEKFREIPEVYLCFDRDPVGREGALRAGRVVPHAKVVDLPKEVGVGGDATDFFVRLGRSTEDFLHLLRGAKPVPKTVATKPPKASARTLQADSEVARLKSRVALEDVARQYLALRQSGRNYTARCPFHDDRHPSFVVFPETQSFYCFSCSAHGDVLSFLMRIEGLDFGEALRVLREVAGNTST